MSRRRPPLENFMKHVSPEPNSGCWLWTAHADKDGYGQFSIWGKGPLRAHRFAYENFRGAIPTELQVLHKCDVPACVNPDHLFLGTNRDNADDRVAKGRSACGERDGNAKLTADAVRAIRVDTRKPQEIAGDFATSVSNVWLIRNGRTWAEVV